MTRRFYLRCVVTLVALQLVSTGCTPHFLLATRDDKVLLNQMLDQEKQQLEQLDRLASRLESMQDDLVVNQSNTIADLQQRIEAQDGYLKELHDKLAKLDGTISALQQNRSAEVIHFNDTQNRAVAADADSIVKQVVGAVERIYISPPGIILAARIDTGATTSSIDARNVEPFERDGKRWVRFEMIDPENDNPVIMECQVVRKTKIIQSVTKEKERRYVVELAVTLGNTTRTAEFTLADRSHVEFPVLIGRNILMDSMTVDVSKKFLSVPILDR